MRKKKIDENESVLKIDDMSETQKYYDIIYRYGTFKNFVSNLIMFYKIQNGKEYVSAFEIIDNKSEIIYDYFVQNYFLFCSAFVLKELSKSVTANVVIDVLNIDLTMYIDYKIKDGKLKYYKSYK